MSDLKRKLEPEASEDVAEVASFAVGNSNQRIRCPYLDTVNRQLLDFDSEKLCSITLTNMNVYACLVCGKFFQGRGKATPAYTHSVQAGHFVFMNLHTTRSFCLPDSYEIFDASLRDVEKCLSPEYSLSSIASLNKNVSLARDIYGISYLPGFIGFNNLNCTDYLNVLLHALGHVTPFRDFFLQKRNYSECKSALVLQFGLVLRKMWSSDNFKSIISPQELMQEISTESKKRFPIGSRAEVLDLLIWLFALLNKELSSVLPADKKKNAALSPVYEPFQGLVEVTSLTRRLVDNYEEQQLLEKLEGSKSSQLVETVSVEGAGDGWVPKVTTVPFTFLLLDVPPNSLFKDSSGGNLIPQIPLFYLMKKFDGATWTDEITKDAHIRKQYRVKMLPRYLIIHLVRFKKNNFNVEKNNTIVTFPVKNLEMKDYLFNEGEAGSGDRQKAADSCPSAAEVMEWSREQIVTLIQKLGSEQQLLELKHLTSPINSSSSGNVDGNMEKKRKVEELAELRLLASQVVERVQLFSSTKYNLVANICHDSTQAAQNVTVGDLNLNFTDAGGVAGKMKAAAAKAKMVNATSAGNNINNGANSSAANNNVLSSGSYKIHVQNKATGQWFEIQDLRVSETTPQLIGVSESNVLIYEKISSSQNNNSNTSSS